MMKKFEKRLLSLLLCAILLIGVLPAGTLTASAETPQALSDAGIEVTFDSVSASHFTGDYSFKVIAEGERMSCNSDSASASATMTVTAAAASVLSFNYAVLNDIDPGTVTMSVNNAAAETITGSDYYVLTLAANETVTIDFAVTTQVGNHMDLVIVKDISLAATSNGSRQTSIKADSGLVGGAVYVDNTDSDGDWPVNNYSNESWPTATSKNLCGVGKKYCLRATPESGYSFVAYYDGTTGELVSRDNDHYILTVPYLNANSNKEFHIAAYFAPASLSADAANAYYKVGDYYTSDFQTALNYAKYSTSKTVVVNKSTTLTGGSYTIPSGVRLLVPFNAEHDLYTAAPVGTLRTPAITEPDPYVIWTLNGVSISVEDGAEISVSAKHPMTESQLDTPNNVDYNGGITGQYGQITMLNSSTITLQDGSNLYAWGFVTGSTGTVVAESGANTFEFFQIADFCGVSAMGMTDKNQFFFTQYYVQNIECKLIINYGANAQVFMDLANNNHPLAALDTIFIGTGGAFKLYDGARMERTYDPVTDKMSYDLIGGSASLETISVSFRGQGIATDSFYLPISNMDVTLTDTQLTTDKKVIFLPGTSVVADEDSEIVITTTTTTTTDPDTGEEVTTTNTGSIVFAGTGAESGDMTMALYSMEGMAAVNSLAGVQNPTLADVNPVIPVKFSPSLYEAQPDHESPRTWQTTADASLENNGTITVDDGASLSAICGADMDGTGAYILSDSAGDADLNLTVTQTVVNVAASQNITISQNITAPAEEIELTNSDGSALDTNICWAKPAVFTKQDGVWGDWRYVELDKYVYDPATGIETKEQIAEGTKTAAKIAINQPDQQALMMNAGGMLQAAANAGFTGERADSNGYTYELSGNIYSTTMEGIAAAWEFYSVEGDDDTVHAVPRYNAAEKEFFDGRSLVLNGMIDYKVYLKLDATNEKPYSSVDFAYTIPETEQTVTKHVESNDLEGSGNVWTASISVAPAEMTYGIDVTLNIHSFNKTVTYREADYASTLFSESYATPAPVAGRYYLVGTINGNNCWADNIRTAYELKQNPSNNAEYMLENVLLYAGDSFKVIRYNFDGQGNNYWYGYEDQTIGTTGIYSIYFNPSGNGSWTSTFFYVQSVTVGESYTQENMDRDRVKNVTSALMNYASKAQIYFERNTYDLANDYVNGNRYTYLDSETDAKINAINAPNTMKEMPEFAGLTYYGTSVILNAGTSIRHYFKITGSDKQAIKDNPPTLTFTFNGQTKNVTGTVYGNYLYYTFDGIDGKGIPGAELDKTLTVSYSGGGTTVSGDYSFYAYAKKALADNDVANAAKLHDLIRAMYWYNIEATTYFNLVNP